MRERGIQPVLQVLIIVSCLIILMDEGISFPPVAAQALCNNQPPIRTNEFPNSFNALKANSWLAGTSALNKRQIALVIYDTESSLASLFEAGIRDWNNYSDCAYVNFNAASLGSNPVGEPPPNAIWVTRGSNTQMFPIVDSSNQMISSNIRIQLPDSSLPNTDELKRGLLRHETGHSFGLLNAPLGAPTIMGGPYINIQACDTQAIQRIYCPSPTPTPTPTPPPPPPGNGCNTCNGTFAGMCEFDNADRPGQPGPPGSCCSWLEMTNCILGGGIWNANTCSCSSPIVVDVLGNGYDLTSSENGISFDLGATGTATQIAWTSIGSDDAWLALDRNGNGTIDRGMELFGDRTPQPFLAEGEIKNGFRALAVFDRLDRGGNADGFITNADSVFADLRLWQDTNHNGYSEPEELHPLPELGLVKIDLDYRESRRRDEHGNSFRFRSKVRDAHGRQFGRWAWDVWLVTQ